jgi:hypothetical protein
MPHPVFGVHMHGNNVLDGVVYFTVPSSEASCILRSDVHSVDTDSTFCIMLQGRELCHWQWARYMFWR